MASMGRIGFFLFWLFLVYLVETEAGEFCYNGVYSSYQYCTFGCCGAYSTYCCSSSSVGLIVGCIFAAVAGIFIMVAVVCCCIKKQAQSGRVVHTANVDRGLAVVYAGGNAHAYGYGFMQPPVSAGYAPQPMMQPLQPPPYKPREEPSPPPYSHPAYPGAGAGNPAGGHAQAPAAGFAV